MTPGELKKIRAAVAEAAAALLARETNGDATAESLAEELADSVVSSVVDTYEAIQTKAYNLVVLGYFQTVDGVHHAAAVGPLSTRATKRARDMGEGFAWDYKTRRGTGRYVVVPLVRNPREAWDGVREEAAVEHDGVWSSPVSGVEGSYEPMRFEMPENVRASISAEWQVSEELLTKKFGPVCRCGRRREVWRAEGGGEDDGSCPRHPEGGNEGDSRS